MLKDSEPAANPPPAEQTCATCRHVGTYKRPKITDATGFDDQLMFEDADETVYMCKASEGAYANTERIEPIVGCATWSAPVKVGADRLAELDRMIAEREARPEKKEARRE